MDTVSVSVLDLWSACRLCGGAIRLIGPDWHHPDARDHTAEPDLVPRMGGRGIVRLDDYLEVVLG